MPVQVRTLQPGADTASDTDVLELLEMILGAMGRDALGMGAGLAHPRESDEWRKMDLRQKLEFFAPIWRVMRDENITVEQVRHLLGNKTYSQIQHTRYEDTIHIK